MVRTGMKSVALFADGTMSHSLSTLSTSEPDVVNGISESIFVLKVAVGWWVTEMREEDLKIKDETARCGDLDMVSIAIWACAGRSLPFQRCMISYNESSNALCSVGLLEIVRRREKRHKYIAIGVM